MSISISYIGIAIGALIMLAGATLFRRKGEAEISTSITAVPAFKVGAVLLIISIIARILLAIL